MTWVSHVLVGTSAGKLAGLSYVLSAFGSVLPDLLEYIVPGRHRGVSHSISVWGVLSVIGWLTGIDALKAIMIGVLIGHLLMDSLTITGVPLYDDRGRYITLFGGRIRTGSAIEYVIAGLIAGLVFLVSNTNTATISIGPQWKTLYDKGIIDLKEYRENRFKIL